MRKRQEFLVISCALAIAAAAVSPALAAYHPKHHIVARHVSAHRVPVVRVAPADEYFGRLKLSILGIRNQLRDLDMRLQYTPDKSADVLGSASFVEDALHDWEHKYPSDPWLANDVYQLTRLYARVNSDDGRRSASRTYRWLMGHYGHTRYAALARTEFVRL